MLDQQDNVVYGSQFYLKKEIIGLAIVYVTTPSQVKVSYTIIKFSHVIFVRVQQRIGYLMALSCFLSTFPYFSSTHRCYYISMIY